MRPDRFVALLVMLVVVDLGCGQRRDDEARADPEPVPLAELGLVRADDLPERSPFVGWESSLPATEAGSGVDSTLPLCGDPSQVMGKAKGLSNSTRSPTFWTSTESVTDISVLVRSFTSVFETPSSARSAYDAVDAKAFAACIAPSVVPEASHLVGADMVPVDIVHGVASKRYREDLDDFVYFDGNDNGTTFVSYVSRVENVNVVVQFIYSGQYFDDVDADLDRLELDIVSAVVARIS